MVHPTTHQQQQRSTRPDSESVPQTSPTAPTSGKVSPINQSATSTSNPFTIHNTDSHRHHHRRKDQEKPDRKSQTKKRLRKDQSPLRPRPTNHHITPSSVLALSRTNPRTRTDNNPARRPPPTNRRRSPKPPTRNPPPSRKTIQAAPPRRRPQPQETLHGAQTRTLRPRTRRSPSEESRGRTAPPRDPGSATAALPETRRKREIPQGHGES